MAWTNNPYCTLSDVKMALDPDMATPGPDDPFLNQLIVQAQADIDREIGYPFQTDGTSQAPATRVYDGQDMPVLYIDDLLTLKQVLEIDVNVYIDANNVYQVGTTTTKDITNDCVLKPNNVSPAYMLKRRSGLPFDTGLQNYSVSGVFGYPTLPGQIYPGIPSDITRITIRLVTHYYKMRDTNYADMMQEGSVREKYEKNMPADVVEVIQRYKRSLVIAGAD